MGDGHLIKRVGREFVKNAFWMVVVFVTLGAILVAATDLPLMGVTVFVGAFVAVLAAIMTGLAFWSGAHEDTSPGGGHSYPGSPPDRGDWPSGGGWDGGRGADGGGGWGGPTRAPRVAPEALLGPRGGLSMQDPASEPRRILLLGTRVSILPWPRDEGSQRI